MSSNERVINKALSGTEMKELLRRDFERLMFNDGLLSDHIAYGRVSYDITLVMRMDNAYNPEAKTTIQSKPEANEDKLRKPALAAVEAHPLKDLGPKGVETAGKLTRNILSPNRERVRSGMGIPVEVRQQDGTVTQEQVTYPPETIDDEGDVVIRDITGER